MFQISELVLINNYDATIPTEGNLVIYISRLHMHIPSGHAVPHGEFIIEILFAHSCMCVCVE